MKKIIGVLLLLFVGCWSVSCMPDSQGINVVPAQVGLNPSCGDERGQAVTVNLGIEGGRVGDRVKIMYRRDDSEWMVHEEFASGAVTIPGPAGEYEIKAQKEGYILESATVIVPNDQDCSVIKQVVNFSLSPAACVQNIPVSVQLITPEPRAGLMVYVRFPNQEPITRQCNSGICAFNLTPQNIGDYEVSFSGIFNSTDSVVDKGYIRNFYSPTEVLISVGNRKHHVVSQAVDSLIIRIPYGMTESGCFEVDFYKIVAESTSMLTSEPGVVAEEVNLLINDINSPICSQSTGETKRVHFQVNIPVGTSLEDIRVQYWKDKKWELAECGFNEGYFCVAEYKNPLIADKYQIRTMIKNQEHIGTLIPLENKCIYFE